MNEREAVAVDSGFLIHALSPGRNGEISWRCRAVWEMFLAEGRRVVVPTPVLAEVERVPSLRVPRVPRVVTVPFDDEAAERLVQSGLVQTKPAGYPKGYWKMDIMIAACVAAAGVTDIVGIDVDYEKIVGPLGLRWRRPEHYQVPTQGDLFGPVR